MTINLDMALEAARYFGAEAVANDDLPGWSKDDRENIADYYGVKDWFDIPQVHQELLLGAYREGKRAEKKTKEKP